MEQKEQPQNWSRNDAKAIVREHFNDGRIDEMERNTLFAIITDLPPDTTDTPRALQGLLRSEVCAAVQTQSKSQGHLCLPLHLC